ncbi:MAG: AMMECR1 domain-containing protein [Candidatus Andersenbacteria bacterium]
MSTYVKLARHSAEHYVRTNEPLPLPPALPPEALRQKACYVSIFENPGRRLRSMYGQPLPYQPTLAEEIITNTIIAISNHQTRRVRHADLSYLVYSVALLGPLQRISDPDHLDPQHFGLYLKSTTEKSALLLPQRVGIETGQDQIATALRESRIDSHREDFTMYRFEVTHYDE